MQTRQEYADKCYEDIMKLYGADEFKQLVGWLQKLRQNHETLPKGSIGLPSYLWVMKRGGGLKTCLQAFTEYLYATNLIEFTGLLRSFIYKLEIINPTEFKFHELTRLDQKIKENAGYHSHFQGVVCIDISHWLENVNSSYFEIFLKYLESKKDQFLTILYMDNDNENVIEKVESSLSANIRFDKICFNFPKTTELLEYVENQFLLPLDYHFSESAKLLFIQLIDDIKIQETFNGFITIEQVIKDILFHLFKADVSGNIISEEMMNEYLKESDYIKQLKKPVIRRTMGFSVK